MKTAKTIKRRALVSVYNKIGIAKFAKALVEAEVQIISSGGTFEKLKAEGIPVTNVSSITKSPEMIGGRVKTLHPNIHAGILADRSKDEHIEQVAKYGIEMIDLVICNLYPFQDTLLKTGNRQELIEKIDIGGPTMIRAAAKNVDSGVVVIVDPQDYAVVAKHITSNGWIPRAVARQLAAKAFSIIAEYDAVISKWYMSEIEAGDFPSDIGKFSKCKKLRYGENPHQKAYLYVDENGFGVAQAKQLHGKELSYNNYLDLEAAYRAAYQPCAAHLCSIIKHTNTCGLAHDAEQHEAFKKAFSCDTVSAFGSVIGFNHKISIKTANAIVESKLFIECIIAPGFNDDALDKLKKKSKQLRLLECKESSSKLYMHKVSGGLLVQEIDDLNIGMNNWKCVTEVVKDDIRINEDLQFAWRAVAGLKSNAIALVKNQMLIGMGTGQPNRVDALRQAADKAKEFGFDCEGAVMASDAFFPFNDCVKEAAVLGITAIVQPGGSKRDQDSIDFCNESNILMLFTGYRHFRH